MYSLANHLAQGPDEWEPGLQAEFEAWVPYEISSDLPDYQLAKDTVLAAGETGYENADRGQPRARGTTVGIGVGIQAITAAVEQVHLAPAAEDSLTGWHAQLEELLTASQHTRTAAVAA